MSCLPYVRSSLRGAAQDMPVFLLQKMMAQEVFDLEDWIMGFLLAWGKAWAQLCELGKVGGRAKPGFLGGCRFQAAAFATPMRGAPPLFSFLLSRQAYHTSRQAIDRSL